jgi:Glyoxalase-like domain
VPVAPRRRSGYVLGVAHHSRLSTILIDAPSGEAPAVAAFWSQALGVPAQPVPDEEQFTSLPGALPDLVLAVQAVDDQARYHVDIETDDVGAETARLVGLGAVEIGRWLECRTLRAPGGHVVCVIPCHSDPETFERLSQVWE